MLVRTALNILSPAQAHARLSVLIFHRVLSAPDTLQPGEMHAQQFDAICGWLKEWFNVLPLDAAVNQLRYGNLPSRACAITFDDGYADNLHIATPILKKHGLCATFFIATGFLNGGRMWNDTLTESIRRCVKPQLETEFFAALPLRSDAEKRVAILALNGKLKYLPVEDRWDAVNRVAAATAAAAPDDLMMTSAEVIALRHLGMQIGAHTVSHPILATLTEEQARIEIQSSRLFLQDLLQDRIGLFAYPNGKASIDYIADHVRIVRELGFDAAVATDWGAANGQTDVFQLPRFTPWEINRGRFGLRLLRNLFRT